MAIPVGPDPTAGRIRPEIERSFQLGPAGRSREPTREPAAAANPDHRADRERERRGSLAHPVADSVVDRWRARSLARSRAPARSRRTPSASWSRRSIAAPGLGAGADAARRAPGDGRGARPLPARTASSDGRGAPARRRRGHGRGRGQRIGDRLPHGHGVLGHVHHRAVPASCRRAEDDGLRLRRARWRVGDRVPAVPTSPNPCIRSWPNSSDIAGLFVGARPAPEELLAAGSRVRRERRSRAGGRAGRGAAGPVAGLDAVRPALLEEHLTAG